MKILSRLNNALSRLKRFRINKYSIAFFGVTIWLLFFDSYNFKTQRQLSSTVKKLEQDKIQLREELETTSKLLLTIENDKEKYARERYYMHAPNEDVFIINKK